MSRLFGFFAVQSTMHMFWLLLMILYNGHFISTGTGVSTRPDVVNIGAILSFNSSIGKVAKVAIEAAVDDVNSDPGVLNGTMLKITMQDTKLSSGFLGIVEGIYILPNILPSHCFHCFLLSSHRISYSF
jgi:ionotropic glutamate receptor